MKKKNLVKIFVLDTNILLHDPMSVLGFEENDIILPQVIFEELDKFKKGNEEINKHTRDSIKIIQEIFGTHENVCGWMPRGKGLGSLKISTKSDLPEVMKTYSPEVRDNLILATVLNEKAEFPGREVVFVTKDINLQLKARILGIETSDYLADFVEVEEVIEDSIKTIEDAPLDLINALYSLRVENIPVPKEKLGMELPKEYSQGMFILKNGSSSVMMVTKGNFVALVKKKQRSYGITPKNAEQAFARYILEDETQQLVILTGKAGTGKTLLALASALQQLSKGTYDAVMLARPIVALGNKDLGFLPGDADEKIAPYMLPLFDNLGVIKKAANDKEKKDIDKWQKDKTLEITPLAYIRGRSLQNVFFIVDEAQNLTPHEIKTIITRAGEGTKIVFTGDIQQIDTPYLSKHTNGPVYVADRMGDKPIVSHAHMKKGERSQLAEMAANSL